MSDETGDYRPIDCGLHSRYELAIMHGTPLHLLWCDAQGEEHEATLRPLDLRTTPTKEELLVAKDEHGARVEIRLDRIREAHFPQP